ncbi:MAG: PEP-CTERM sorting domain-containing protein [bacterium]|nr:PEP-CTERM sorting domain-containing protein [bacterium]
MRTNGIIALLSLLIGLALPSSAMAVDFVSDFVDFESDWLLEDGSDALQDLDSIVLSAAEISPRQRGRILTQSLLAATPEDIRNATYILDASDVSAPIAARAIYFDAAGDFIRSEPLFGTLEGGRIIALGTVLNPDANTAGLKIRLYSNAPTGSVRFSEFKIEEGLNPIPEPGTTLLMGLGLAGLASVRRTSRV